MLSLRELRRAVAAAHPLIAGARLQAVSEPDALSVAMEFYAPAQRERRRLLFCCDPRSGRLCDTPVLGKRGGPAGALLLWLRSHAVGMRVEQLVLCADDRHVVLTLARDAERAELRLLLMGGRSNLYAVDGSGRLVAAQRRLESTRRDLALGGAWRDPEPAQRPEGEDRFAACEEGELLDAIARAYAATDAERGQEERERQLAQALRKRLQGLDRKARAIERDLTSAARAEEHERHGELLKGALGAVRPGAEQVEVSDYATGLPVTIPLDPTLDARGNLERLFKRARKARRQALQAEQRRGELDAQREEVRALQAELAALVSGGGDLDAFSARPEVARLLSRYAPQALPQEPGPRRKGPFADLPARLRPRRYRTAGELEVWVGRSDAGNDHLTTRLARGRDLFLHLEAAPGSHVVLRTNGREDPPSEALLDAAELAVHFSSQKNAGAADVHVAPIKDVRKPKGAKPGLVHVLRGRTLHLRRDPARLRAVLDARCDEDA